MIEAATPVNSPVWVVIDGEVHGGRVLGVTTGCTDAGPSGVRVRVRICLDDGRVWERNCFGESVYAESEHAAARRAASA